MLQGRGDAEPGVGDLASRKIPNIPNRDLSDILSCPIRGGPMLERAVAKCQGARWQVQALLLMCCVTLGKALPFSGPHYFLL